MSAARLQKIRERAPSPGKVICIRTEDVLFLLDLVARQSEALKAADEVVNAAVNGFDWSPKAYRAARAKTTEGGP